jgi:hypothetical protein
MRFGPVGRWRHYGYSDDHICCSTQNSYLLLPFSTRSFLLGTSKRGNSHCLWMIDNASVEWLILGDPFRMSPVEITANTPDIMGECFRGFLRPCMEFRESRTYYLRYEVTNTAAVIIIFFWSFNKCSLVYFPTLQRNLRPFLKAFLTVLIRMHSQCINGVFSKTLIHIRRSILQISSQEWRIYIYIYIYESDVK